MRRTASGGKFGKPSKVPTGKDERPIARCHAAKRGEPFAGGMPLNTPFGVIYSTNITPDPDTGIGRRPLEAFTRAGDGIREF
jgi:hypothetical protein